MILLADQETDKPEESNNEQDNALPPNAKSSSGESPPVERKNISINGDNSLIGRGNICRPII